MIEYENSNKSAQVLNINQLSKLVQVKQDAYPCNVFIEICLSVDPASNDTMLFGGET